MDADFTEVYDTRTGLKQRVPAVWLEDPILGRFIKKTPGQRALDGELGQAPTEDSTVKEIKAFADDAGIDVTGLKSKDELLGAVRAVVGTDPLPEPVPADDVAVSRPPIGGSFRNGDPIDANQNGEIDKFEPDPVGDHTPDTDSAPAEPENPDTPAAGDEEN